MSQSRSGLLWVVTGLPLAILVQRFTSSLMLTIVTGVLTFAGAALVVWYSPYPDSTHAFGGGQRRQQWGFTTKQDGDKWIREPQNPRSDKE